MRRFVFILFLISSIRCSNDDGNEPSSVTIGDYTFNFPTRFVLEEAEGIDSFVGQIRGDGITLNFDFGPFTGPLNNVSEDQFEILEDEIEGHFRQIVIPFDSNTDRTRIHLFRIQDTIDMPSLFDRLTMSTTNLSATQQDVIVEAFESVDFE